MLMCIIFCTHSRIRSSKNEASSQEGELADLGFRRDVLSKVGKQSRQKSAQWLNRLQEDVGADGLRSLGRGEQGLGLSCQLEIPWRSGLSLFTSGQFENLIFSSRESRRNCPGRNGEC